jgi:hypothetical protein
VLCCDCLRPEHCPSRQAPKYAVLLQGEMDHDAAEAEAAALHLNAAAYAVKDDDMDYDDPAYGMAALRGGSRARAAARGHTNAATAQPAADGVLDSARLSAIGRAANGGRGGPGFSNGAAAGGVLRPGSAGGRGMRATARGGARGGNGGGRSRGRIGRGLSEAAAALLDMGFAEDEADAVSSGSQLLH